MTMNTADSIPLEVLEKRIARLGQAVIIQALKDLVRAIRRQRSEHSRLLIAHQEKLDAWGKLPDWLKRLRRFDVPEPEVPELIIPHSGGELYKNFPIELWARIGGLNPTKARRVLDTLMGDDCPLREALIERLERGGAYTL